MCGICGRYNFRYKVPVDEGIIHQMCSNIIHRGPDNQGIYMDNEIGLGMRRLSIIDLDTGNQPIFNEDRSIVVIFNGEIYNFKELKNDLEKKGHVFKTHSDTETIVHAFEEYGESFVNRLNGEFAIALFNILKRELFLYRDRFGIKPLFYQIDENKIIFSSEIKSILLNKDFKKNIDYHGLDLFLSFGYITSPYTIFDGIQKLEPSHYLKISNTNTATKIKYWDFSFCENSFKKESLLKEEFLALFSDSVKLRMQSDVPYGAFLSGGIDSSLIVALMNNHTIDQVRTFSLGYLNDEYYNETKYAEIIAKKYNTLHKSFLVDSSVLTNYLDLFITHFDEPFSDYSAFPVYEISKNAKKDVTVILSGDGGDEVFSGYKRYYAELIAKQVKLIPPFLRNVFLKNILSIIARKMPATRYRDYLDFSIKKLEMLNLEDISRYYYSSTHNYFTYEEKKKLFKDASLLSEDFSFHHFQKFWVNDSINDYLGIRQYLDIFTKLPDDMLAKVDRMSMAASLEVRVPFLDHRIVEFASKLPSNTRMSLFKMKKFLKNASYDYLPKDIINRHKHGFSSPIDRWFREDLKELAISNLLGNHELLDILDKKYIRMLFEEHINKKANHGDKLFSLLILLLWYKRYING